MLDILTASIETLDDRIVHLKEENLENIEFDSEKPLKITMRVHFLIPLFWPETVGERKALSSFVPLDRRIKNGRRFPLGSHRWACPSFGWYEAFSSTTKKEGSIKFQAVPPQALRS